VCSNPMASSTSGAICADESRIRGIPSGVNVVVSYTAFEVHTVSSESGVDEVVLTTWDRAYEGETVYTFTLDCDILSLARIWERPPSNLYLLPVQQPPSLSGLPSSARVGPGQSLTSDAGHDLQKSDTPTNCLSSSSLGMTTSGV
jgi:hypothetical protein